MCSFSTTAYNTLCQVQGGAVSAGEALSLGAPQGHWPFQSVNEFSYLDAAFAHLCQALPLDPASEELWIGPHLGELPFST